MKTFVKNIVFTTALISIVFIGESFAISSAEQSNAYSLNENNSSVDNRRKIRLGFTGPSTMHRQLLLTEDVNATSGIDWGYDSAYFETGHDDIYWLIEGQFFIIQGTDVIEESSNFPLGFHTYTNGLNTIGIDALENFSDDFELYIFDKELEVYHNLSDGDYDFYADAGDHEDRFELVFTDPLASSSVLSVDENEKENFKIHYNGSSNTLIINNVSNAVLKSISIYNMAGQLVKNDLLNGNLTRREIQLNSQIAKSTYIVVLETELTTVSKKILLY